MARIQLCSDAMIPTTFVNLSDVFVALAVKPLLSLLTLDFLDIYQFPCYVSQISVVFVLKMFYHFTQLSFILK